jgi:PPOX class probable F420-dependent enzyme
MNDFATLDNARYLNLETFRKNGQGVRTPVWFAAEPDEDPTLYVYSTRDSGKAKRIRRSGEARVAACDVRGRVTGPWIDTQAAITDGDAARRAMQLIDRKYRPWKQMLDLFARLRPRHARVVIAIRGGGRAAVC